MLLFIFLFHGIFYRNHVYIHIYNFLISFYLRSAVHAVRYEIRSNKNAKSDLTLTPDNLDYTTL